MPCSLLSAIDTEVKRQGVPADQIQKLELDQKCRAAAIQGLERFTNLVTLSLGSVNLTSLANFPQLPKLQSLLLSDNRIAGGLEALTEAKLDHLTELDLSNNKFASLPSFKPLADLRSLQALHVQANPAEKSVKGLRQALFAMIAALQYVDDTDRFGKERPALEEEDDDGDEYEDEEDDVDEPNDEDSEEANDDAEQFEEHGEGAGEGGGAEQGGGYGDDDEDDDEDDDDVAAQFEIEDQEEDEDSEDEDEDEPEPGTAFLVGMIPQEIEDDPQEYEGEVDDAPSEDFDDEEDEEGGIAFSEAVRQANKRKRSDEEEDVDDDDDEDDDDDDDAEDDFEDEDE